VGPDSSTFFFATKRRKGDVIRATEIVSSYKTESAGIIIKRATDEIKNTESVYVQHNSSIIISSDSGL
jgi:hypothetical protein